eukprot:Sdes_comp20072_c0_seq1m12973
MITLYTNHGRFLEASTIVLNMLNSLAGSGSENPCHVNSFGLTNELSPTEPAVLLPYTAIDRLLHELKHSTMNSETSHESNPTDYKRLFDEMNQQLEEYFRKAKSCSKNFQLFQKKAPNNSDMCVDSLKN